MDSSLEEVRVRVSMVKLFFTVYLAVTASMVTGLFLVRLIAKAIIS
jgi:hypothetical protein